MAAAVFTQRSCQVPANAYLGLNASSGVPALYTAGAVKYVVYEPSSTALATFGWTGLPYRVLLYWPTGSSALTGVGVNEGAQMTDNTTNLGAKLGYGTANDGSLASPIQTWPTLVVCPQTPNAWTPAISGAVVRADWMIHDAVLADVFANYNCDPNFLYGTGVSAGGGNLMEYAMGSYFWPTRFPTRYAAISTIAGSFSGSGTRQDWPEAIPGENSVNQTFIRLSKVMIGMRLPWWEVHSTLDNITTPAIYNNWTVPMQRYWPDIGNPIPAGQSAGTLHYHGPTLRFTEFTGASAPFHGGPPSIFDYFYGNNNTVSNGPGGMTLIPTDPWATWMFQQSLRTVPKRLPTNLIYTYAGGSAGPRSGGGSSTIIARRRRR